MLLEVTDSTMSYRSRYFTILQPAPVLDLLMNDEANPRSLAFQIKEKLNTVKHCPACRPALDGRSLAQERLEEATSELLRADVRVPLRAGRG